MARVPSERQGPAQPDADVAARERGRGRRPDGDPPNPLARWSRRLSVLDWIAIALFILGWICVATGLLPAGQADATIRRILPLLLFLATILVLAELTATAGVFDVLAARVAIIGRGNYFVLFVLCVAFAAMTTICLNLDTTAVLLTPVMLALARSLRVPPLPFAMCTVWLANTGSLLLPVSNLTNLLAANRVALAPLAFAGRMAAPQLTAIAATMVFLWVFYWRRPERGARSYEPPRPFEPADRVLFRVAAIGCLFFVAAILGGVELGVASAIAAGLVVAAFAARRRSDLRLSLIPWRLPVFVTGLFLVVQTISVHLLSGLTRTLVSTNGDALGVFRAAATGAGLANVVNNLPAYVAGEAVVPVANHLQLLGLLVGVNVGPVIAPWASLATLLWYERCRSQDVRIPGWKFSLTGAGLAVVALAASVGALVAAG
jgi:arsenical pump membrane protein